MEVKKDDVTEHCSLQKYTTVKYVCILLLLPALIFACHNNLTNPTEVNAATKLIRNGTVENFPA